MGRFSLRHETALKLLAVLTILIAAMAIVSPPAHAQSDNVARGMAAKALSQSASAALGPSGVTAGSYNCPALTVTTRGLVSAASNGTCLTSVGLTAPSALLNVTGSPLVANGSLALTLVTPTANKIFASDISAPAGPASTFTVEGTGVGFENTSSTNVTYPANPVAGDTAFLQVSSFANSVPTFNTPAGWTLVTQQGDGCCIGAALFYKVLTGSETGTVTATFTAEGANNGGQAAISYWHGLKTTGTPYEAVASNVAHNSTAGVGSSVTTTGSNETVVTFWAPVVGSTTDPGSSTPASWTTAYNSDQTSTTHFNGRLIADYRVAASPTTISAATRTWASGSTTWVSISLAMLPGPGAPGTPAFRPMVTADLPATNTWTGVQTFAAAPILPTSTVASLTACAAGTKGALSMASDSTVAASTNFGVAVAGGGTNVVKVYCDGTSWKIG